MAITGETRKPVKVESMKLIKICKLALATTVDMSVCSEIPLKNKSLQLMCSVDLPGFSAAAEYRQEMFSCTCQGLVVSWPGLRKMAFKTKTKLLRIRDVIYPVSCFLHDSKV